MMYISIDVGGTKINIGLFDKLESPTLLNSRKIPTQNNFQEDLDNIYESISILTNDQKISGIGIGLPGIVKSDKSGMNTSVNLPSWQGKNLKELLSQIYATEVMIEQDVNLAALGESIYSKNDLEKFVFIIWGTGLAATYVNKISKDQIVFAQLELGHHVLKSGGKDYEKFIDFALESKIGGNSIKKIYNKNAEDLNDKEWDEVLDFMNVGIFNLISFYNPKKIIFGGGIGLGQKDRIAQISDRLSKSLYLFDVPPQISFSTLGEAAGLYGGLVLLNENIKLIQL